MKKYEVTFTEDDDGVFRNHRKNTGFTIMELIGMLEVVKQDLFIQYLSMIAKPSTVEREFINSSTKGKITVEREI